ncbi:unnamed protein product [Pleuronectes platessa]|uniref:Uncharacterized protein n=1 Tax=Pleuronectes platessa TaxID=8262 RepID=A0A9N7YQT6_PLEPL|nr:unnamed protein product [Pleuronectes platessa]
MKIRYIPLSPAAEQSLVSGEGASVERSSVIPPGVCIPSLPPITRSEPESPQRKEKWGKNLRIIRARHRRARIRGCVPLHRVSVVISATQVLDFFLPPNPTSHRLGVGRQESDTPPPSLPYTAENTEPCAAFTAAS